MKPVYFLAIIPLALILQGGCQSTFIGVEYSSHYTIPSGSRIKLNREISFAPNKVSVFIQYGAIKPNSELDHYYPHCKFELYKMMEVPQLIKPDTFTVIRTSLEEFASGPLRQDYAAFGFHSADGSISHIEYITYLYLGSETQPNVYLLSCLHWGNPEDDHLSIAEIRQALGEIMTLELNTP